MTRQTYSTLENYVVAVLWDHGSIPSKSGHAVTTLEELLDDYGFPFVHSSLQHVLMNLDEGGIIFRQVQGRKTFLLGIKDYELVSEKYPDIVVLLNKNKPPEVVPPYFPMTEFDYQKLAQALLKEVLDITSKGTNGS